MTTHTDARLTTKQRELRNEISALLEWLQVVPDLSAIDPADRTERLAWAKRELIISTVLREYLLMDEHLNNEMCREFFPKGTYAALWGTKRFRAFNHHVLERLYLVQKLEFVRARIPLSKEFYKDILALNDLRNAVAHSFFPENRRVKPKWKGVDIFAPAGINQFITDMQQASKFFFVRFHRHRRYVGRTRPPHG